MQDYWKINVWWSKTEGADEEVFDDTLPEKIEDLIKRNEITDETCKQAVEECYDVENEHVIHKIEIVHEDETPYVYDYR